MMDLSPLFSAVLVFAAVAFALFVGIAALKKRRQVEIYEQLALDNTPRLDGELVRAMQQGGSSSYQQSGSFNQMGSNEQKTVTYCMIDGRLLDE